jgi:hypothetical protein
MRITYIIERLPRHFIPSSAEGGLDFLGSLKIAA